MTLPASGPISINNINVELTLAGTTQTTMLFINNLVLASQRPATPNMAGYYSKAYFQNSTNGNCNNANNPPGACNCDCGGLNCNNCQNCIAINCANCDTQKWLQTNCNCACTYNCNVTTVSYDCDCNCTC